MQETTLASLPIQILTLIHSHVFQADATLRSCLALEATCKHLRGLFSSNARFKEVVVKHENLATAHGDSFWRWIATHGTRTDLLRLQRLELHLSTPRLCSHAGVLEARAVDVNAAIVETLEPLRGLINLAAVEYSNVSNHPDGSISVAPLAGLPALERVVLGGATATITSLAPLCHMAALTSLTLDNFQIPHLDQLRSLSQLSELALRGFPDVTSVAPLSCLTSLTELLIMYFPSLDSIAPLHALTRLQRLSLVIASSGSISLQPLRQLTSLTALVLRGDKERDTMTEYDLQPLSALSRTLPVLSLQQCVLRSLPSLGSLGPMLRQLTLMDCECQPPGFQLASLLPHVPRLILLDSSDVTAADLDAIGQHLTCLLFLTLKRAHRVTSMAALTSLTRLRSITLQSCSHISSIDPLAALTKLTALEVLSCPQLTSLNPLIALQSLRQLRLEGCPQLVASLPASMQYLTVSSHD
jgi:internalin A